MFRPLWIEIDLEALDNNLAIIRNQIGKDVEILAMIKQAGYGHGLSQIAWRLSKLGVNFFAVGSLEEAIALRKDGFLKRILVASAVLPEYAKEFVDYSITPIIVEDSFAKRLDAYAKEKDFIIPGHIKIDTGMGRLGPNYKDAYEFVLGVNNYKNIQLEGIYSHFPVADSQNDFTQQQIVIFESFIARLKARGIDFKYKHIANSSGIINYPNAHFNMVRPGLILYGIKPKEAISLDFQPVISLKAKIIFIKSVERGKSIGYGRTFIAQEDTRIATIAVGYADGYSWSIGNNSDSNIQPKVIIKDSYFPIVGRVCMDHIMVDIGLRQDIEIGQEVILIGRKNSLEITASDLANWAKTIPYEIISQLSWNIPRIYVNQDSLVTK